MSLLTLPETSIASTTVLRKPDVLRVRIGEEEAVRVVPLADGKTTIGSSPQCTIVLPGADCRPLQCVVTVDAHRAEATRWGAGVQLNLRDFSKSMVAVGDKLTIGRCELEFANEHGLDERVVAAETVAAKPTCTAEPPAPVELSKVKLPAAEKPRDAVAPTPLGSTTNPLPASLATIEPPHAQPAPTSTLASTALVIVPQPPAPLASPPTVVVEATPPHIVVSETKPALTYSSHAFADELILHLWQVGDRSQRRAKALIAATRDARFRAEAMAADLAAMEIELDLARAAYDSHAANHEQLHLELIERDRIAAERIGPLVGEVEALRSQLQEAQVELAEQAARCDELNAALEVNESSFVAAASSQAAETARAAELEQSLAVQIEQATLLAHELGAVRTELDGVRRELEQQAARRQELEAELAATQTERDAIKQQAHEAADQAARIQQLRGEVESLHDERAQFAGKLGDAEVELSRLTELCRTANDRVAELEHVIAAQAASAPETMPEPTSLEQTPLERSAGDSQEEAVGEPASPLAIDETAWNTAPEPAPEAVETSSDVSHESALQAWTPAEEPEPAACDAKAEGLLLEPEADANHADESSGAFEMPASMPVKTVPVASELAPTSFIDKYRHLLDDDSASSSAPAAPPQIDDEFLSPAKAADRTVPADDSDEALDAYMASMMERMRSHASPGMPAMTESTPLSPAAAAPVEPAPLDYDPSVPFEIESMKQGRKAPVSTDLAALREIANTSARSAIETHRKKRKVESAVGKIVIAVISFATGGYLILNAPTLHDWQFGAGAAIGLIGFGAAALAMRHPDRSESAHVDLPLGGFAAGEAGHGDA